MLYAVVRPVAKTGFKVFFRHIHIQGLENIPREGPLLLAANHPTAFIEPCVAACFQHRTLHFIVRGDIFKNPFYIKILKALHLIPIFRFKDGYTNLKQNQETFRYVNQVLQERKTIFILAEGRTIQEKKLRPVQKGPARMAFGAYDAYGVKDTKIIPIGFNYEQANAWRKDVMIQCGTPISVADFIPAYHENPLQAIQSLTDEIASGLAKNLVIIHDVQDEQACDILFEITKNDHSSPVFPIVIRNNERLITEKKIAAAFNNISEPEKSKLSTIANIYRHQLEQYKIVDANVIVGKSAATFPAILLLIILQILFLPGALYYFIPVMTARMMTSKRVYVKEFQAPVLFALSAFFVIIWSIFSLTSGIMLFGVRSIILILILLLFGFLSIPVYEALMRNLSQRRFNRLQAETQQELFSSRNTMREWIQKNI